MRASQKKLVGIIQPMPSFRDEDGNLMLDRQREHIRWLIDSGYKEGTAVLFTCAGLSEGYLTLEDEFQRLVDVLADEARGEVATCAGIFDFSCRLAARKAAYAAKAGIDFVQVAPPHYFCPSEQDVLRHYRYIAERADIGIMAYNTPWAMPSPGYEFSATLLTEFAKIDNIVGIKWASFDISHYVETVQQFSDHFHFIENMNALSLGARLGMKGFIEWWGNALPKYGLKKWELLKAKKWDEFDELILRTRVEPFRNIINPERAAWVGVGEGPRARFDLLCLGLETGPAFPCQAPLSQVYLEETQRAIKASGVLEEFGS